MTIPETAKIIKVALVLVIVFRDFNQAPVDEEITSVIFL